MFELKHVCIRVRSTVRQVYQNNKKEETFLCALCAAWISPVAARCVT